MKIKNFLFGAACGIAIGWFAQNYVNKQQYLPSEDVLRKVKSILAKDGKVIGSWIMTKPETIERDSIEYKVYQGGITKQLDDQQFNISFIVDAKTGTILEIEKA